MWTGIDILYTLQDLRMDFPILEEMFKFLSSRLFYLVLPMLIALALYWVADKRQGEIVILSCVSGMSLAMSAKFIIAQPRPWILDPSIEHVEGINSNGYSCPSGHTTISVSTYIPAAVFIKKHIVSLLLVILTILIISARLVLCAHTPLDIMVGVLIGSLSAVVAWKAVDIGDTSDRNFIAVNAAYLMLFIATFLIAIVLFDADVYEISRYAGFLYGMILGRCLEHFKMHHSVNDGSVVEKIKMLIIGSVTSGIVLAVPMILIPNVGTFIGGFLLMIWGLAVFPKLYIERFRLLLYLTRPGPPDLIGRKDSYTMWWG